MSSLINIIDNNLSNTIINTYREESILLMPKKMLSKLRIISKNA